MSNYFSVELVTQSFPQKGESKNACSVIYIGTTTHSFQIYIEIILILFTRYDFARIRLLSFIISVLVIISGKYITKESIFSNPFLYIGDNVILICEMLVNLVTPPADLANMLFKITGLPKSLFNLNHSVFAYAYSILLTCLLPLLLARIIKFYHFRQEVTVERANTYTAYFAVIYIIALIPLLGVNVNILPIFAVLIHANDIFRKA